MLSESAAKRFAPMVTSVDPSVELAVMADDGTLHDESGTRLADDVTIDVAWATGDLFTDGGPAHAFIDRLTAEQGLRWFQSPAAGIDNPIYGPLIDRGVRVSNSHLQSVPISEFVMRAALDHFQDPTSWIQSQARQVWKRRRFREVYGSTWLIVGFGAIATDVAVRARAFRARVIGVRRHPTGQEPVDRMVAPDELVEVVGEADVIVLTAPSTPATRHLVNRQFLARTRPDAVLINVGRGALVDQEALVDALDAGRLGAAVLDVAEPEPLPAGHPLWTHPRVALTPHNSAMGSGTHARFAELFCQNLSSYLTGGPLENELFAADVADAPKVSPRGDTRL